MNIMQIATEYNPGGENPTAEWKYRLNGDVWEVNGPETDGWENFADGTANERDVRQLLRKEYSYRY